MKVVLLRDDDTNALTPPALLDRLYRPFLVRGLPVNLSVIPEVLDNITLPNGQREGFLLGGATGDPQRIPVVENHELIAYLQENSGYHVIQHGLSHEFVDGHYEFDRDDRDDLARRLDRGSQLLQAAGFPRPETFVAPHDRLSRVALKEVAKRYRILSCGWYALRRLPWSWRPHYVLKKALNRDHWQVGGTKLLSHPGCLLSRSWPYETMLDNVKNAVAARDLTVLVTHWWEYFPQGQPDTAFIQVLHQTANYLADEPAIHVISFRDLIK